MRWYEKKQNRKPGGAAAELRSGFDSRPVLSEEANTSENTHCGKDSSAERRKKDENIQRIVGNDGEKD